MTQQLIEDYLQSFSKLDEVSHAVEQVFTNIKKMHSVLSRWESLHDIPDLDHKDSWPTLETIEASIKTWTEANKETCKKWGKLSEEERKGLKSPNERKGRICE